MKKILFLCGVLTLISGCSGAAFADTSADNKRVSEAQALTRAAPVLADFETKGLQLHWLNGHHIMVCAAAGQTLSGAGQLDAYRFDEVSGMVSRNPGKDLPIAVTATSCGGSPCRCENWDDFYDAQSEGYLMYAANAVTVSGGTLTVFYFGYKRIR